MCFLIVKITCRWHQSGRGPVLYLLVLNHLLPQWGCQSGHLQAQELNRTPSGILLPSSPPCQAVRWRAAILKKASKTFFFLQALYWRALLCTNLTFSEYWLKDYRDCISFIRHKHIYIIYKPEPGSYMFNICLTKSAVIVGGVQLMKWEQKNNAAYCPRFAQRAAFVWVQTCHGPTDIVQGKCHTPRTEESRGDVVSVRSHEGIQDR